MFTSRLPDEGWWHRRVLTETPGPGVTTEALGFQHPPPGVSWTLPEAHTSQTRGAASCPTAVRARLRAVYTCVPRGPTHLLVEKVLLAEVGPLLVPLLAVLGLPQHRRLLHGPDGHFLREASATAAQPPGAMAVAIGTPAQGMGTRRSAVWGQAPAPTSPSALTRTVRKLSPVPQLRWLFHTSVAGGLWATPAPAAHT